MNNTERELLLQCSCNTHIIKLAKFDDDDELYVLYFDTYLYPSENIFRRILNSIKYIFNRTPILLYDVILEEDEVLKIKEYLNKNYK